MPRNLKSCFALSICLFFFLPGFTYSEEEKSASKGESSDKARIEKNQLRQPDIVFSLKKGKFSMDNNTLSFEKDSDGENKSPDPDTDKSLKKTDPDSKREVEVVDCKKTWLDLLKNKLNLVRTDEKYAITIIRPNPDIDPEIFTNITSPGTEYSMNIINPYTKRKTTGYAAPSFGLSPHKIQQKDK